MFFMGVMSCVRIRNILILVNENKFFCFDCVLLSLLMDILSLVYLNIKVYEVVCRNLFFLL